MSDIDPDTIKTSAEAGSWIASILTLGIFGWIAKRHVSRLDTHEERIQESEKTQAVIQKDIETHTEGMKQLHTRIDGVEKKFEKEHEITREAYKTGNKELIESIKQIYRSERK